MLYFELQFKQGFERASRIDLQVRRRTACQRNRNGHTGRQCQANIKDTDKKKEKKKTIRKRTERQMTVPDRGRGRVRRYSETKIEKATETER